MIAFEVLGTYFDTRRIYKCPTQSLTFGAADTVKSFDISANGALHSAVVEVPDWTNAVTLVLSVEDEEGTEVYNSPALSDNAIQKIIAHSEAVGFDGIYTVKLTLSGAPGGSGGTVKLTMLME
jgi:hypothetical protein